VRCTPSRSLARRSGPQRICREIGNRKRRTLNAERPTSNSDSDFDVGRWVFSAIIKIVMSLIAAAVSRKVRHQGE